MREQPVHFGLVLTAPDMEELGGMFGIYDGGVHGEES